MMKEEAVVQKKKWYERMPHSYVILFMLIVISAVLTWVLPAGSFERTIPEGATREYVVPGTYTQVDQTGVGVFGVLKAIPKGMDGACTIIFMIMISTAAFHVIRSTGALDNGIGVIMKKVKTSKIPGNVVICTVTFLFSLLGVIVGPEIQLPFAVLGISIALSLGYDTIVGLGMVAGGGFTGFAFGPINAAVLGSAHAIMGMETFSGQGLRWLLWLAATITVCIITCLYARKITKNPEKSLVKGIDTSSLQIEEKEEGYEVTGKHKLVLAVLILLMATIIVGASKFGWYLTEMTAVFLVGGIAAGLVYGYKINKIIDLFIQGAASAASVALIVGIARGIQVVLEEGHILDTIINALSSPLQAFNPLVGAIFISIIVGIIHFFIPSGSGLAYATMPIIGPLGELIGISPQTTVLAFQIGATVPNFIFPTIGAFMAVLGLAKVPLGKWMSFGLKLVAALYVVSWIFIAIAFAIGY
ncbi:MAG: YfcC family protein [Lachnospiraceae bacterium]|nr:YfcC family protein [Lachnospiraceae bacterium]GFI03747.1 hypothetical protein IMSAGC005_02587 [Lachnospiraceae bacterium]